MEVPDSLVNAILHDGARVQSWMQTRCGPADIEINDLMDDIDQLRKLGWKNLKKEAKKIAKE